MCGEKSLAPDTAYNATGSPPHVRGKAQAPGGQGSGCRDHPRMCGEKQSVGAGTNGKVGSPPHVRGKVVFDEFIPERIRITPACAGKRGLPADWSCRHRDHPRMCGEKKHSADDVTSGTGSPPHVRGKDAFTLNVSFLIGITPACAGKRCRFTACRACTRDHPRMCGEKRHGGPLARPVLGSPPHVRGKVTLGPCAGRVAGITPACAGKRLKRSRSTVPHAAIVPLFPSVCNKPAGSDGSPAGHDAPPFLPIENAAPASPAYNLRSL